MYSSRGNGRKKPEHGSRYIVSFRDKKFGRLTIRYALNESEFYCECVCGNELVVWRSLLANNVQRDCGMCRRTVTATGLKRTSVHGHIRSFVRSDGSKKTFVSAEFHTWANMIRRCHSKSHHAFGDYGGRGIRVCKRWREPKGQGFLNFIRDLGPRPQYKTLDRINPQGHYEKTNCRWADRKVQANNTRRRIWQHCAPPPVEKIREMEARIKAEYAEMNPGGLDFPY